MGKHYDTKVWPLFSACKMVIKNISSSLTVFIYSPMRQVISSVPSDVTHPYHCKISAYQNSYSIGSMPLRNSSQPGAWQSEKQIIFLLHKIIQTFLKLLNLHKMLEILASSGPWKSCKLNHLWWKSHFGWPAVHTNLWLGAASRHLFCLDGS